MQNIKLNLIPGAVMPVVNVSQYDKARQFSITVYEGASTYSLTGKEVQIRGTKPDGNGFAYDSTDGVVSVSGSTVTISTTQQMTAVGGQTMAELQITQSGVILGTLNFILMVEPSALSDDTPISDTDIPAIERDFEAALAEAEADALKAEGYAVGTQDGTPAQSGEPYYQDNAKYYKEQAEAAASGGGADALKAEGYAVGTQNGVPVTSGSPYYHNNAAYYEGEASTSATNAATSETNAGLSETAAGNSATSAASDALEAEGWAVGEQNGVPVTSGSPYYENNAKYYCQQSPHTALTSLTDVDISSPSNDQVLKYDNATQKWVNGTGGGGASDLDDLTDVTLTSPASGQVLEYDGSKWANANLPTVPTDLDDLGDVDLTTPTSGQFLKYDGAKWVNGNGGGGASALDDLTDVDITTPTDGQVLTYDGASQKWVNADGGGSGGGFDYKDWLAAANIPSAGFADLAAVLADEETVRHLMTIHTAVDYLTGFPASDASIGTILNNNIAAKWINLRDYALDKLEYAFSAVMASADKYGYGEWAKLSESPETWGPKGNVPIMTSNTAPYGAASAYQVFDDNSATTASGTDFSYKFVNPICPKSFECKDTGGNAITGGTLQGSDDGSTWEMPQSGKYYLYLRVHFESSTTVATVQFYGRELKVSVPVMTSNTAPYGVASASGEYSTRYAWKAFDGTNADSNDQWNVRADTGWIAYEFPSNVCLKMVAIKPAGSASGSRVKDFEVQVSNDNFTTYDTLYSDIIANENNNPTVHYYNLTNTAGYKKCRIYCNGHYDADTIGMILLQFYGFDYSEYDWDADNPRHYLYDHGVTPNGNMLTYKYGADAVAEERLGSELFVYRTAANSLAEYYASPQIDATSYNRVRVLAGMYAIDSNNSNNYATIGVTTNTYFSENDSALASNTMFVYTPNDKPNALLDISSVNQTVAVFVYVRTVNAYNRGISLSEMWLE